MFSFYCALLLKYVMGQLGLFVQKRRASRFYHCERHTVHGSGQTAHNLNKILFALYSAILGSAFCFGDCLSPALEYVESYIFMTFNIVIKIYDYFEVKQ